MFRRVVRFFRQRRGFGGGQEIRLLEDQVHHQITGTHERDHQRQPDHTSVTDDCSHAQHCFNYRGGAEDCQFGFVGRVTSWSCSGSPLSERYQLDAGVCCG